MRESKTHRSQQHKLVLNPVEVSNQELQEIYKIISKERNCHYLDSTKKLNLKIIQDETT